MLVFLRGLIYLFIPRLLLTPICFICGGTILSFLKGYLTMGWKCKAAMGTICHNLQDLLPGNFQLISSWHIQNWTFWEQKVDFWPQGPRFCPCLRHLQATFYLSIDSRRKGFFQMWEMIGEKPPVYVLGIQNVAFLNSEFLCW